MPLPAAAVVQRVESSPCNKWTGVQSSINHNVFPDNKYSVNGNAIINCVNGNDISDLFLTLTTYPNSCSKRVKTFITKRGLTFDSYAQFQQLLKAEEWDLMDAMTLEESTNYLTDRINSGLDMVAPIQTKYLGKKTN